MIDVQIELGIFVFLTINEIQNLPVFHIEGSSMLPIIVNPVVNYCLKKLAVLLFFMITLTQMAKDILTNWH